MIRFRPLPVMSLVCVLALALLIALGRWQWERYQTKQALAGEPVAEMTIANFEPVPRGLQFVFGVRPDTHETGWRVFTPVMYGESVVFVDAAFEPGQQPPAPDEVRVPPSLRAEAPLRGASIRPEHAPFAASPIPLRRLWFAIDLPAMGRNAGLDRVADYYIAAAYIGPDGRAAPNPFARAGGADTLPPARHLGYALTWYGLAIVLLGVYLAYHVSVGRLGVRAPRPRED